MTLTIELPPAREARLREKAAKHGKDVAAYLLDLADPEGAGTPPAALKPLSEYTSDAEFVAEAIHAAARRGHDPATVASIAQGIADGEAGREISLEEYVAQMQAERAARRSA